MIGEPVKVKQKRKRDSWDDRLRRVREEHTAIHDGAALKADLRKQNEALRTQNRHTHTRIKHLESKVQTLIFMMSELTKATKAAVALAMQDRDPEREEHSNAIALEVITNGQMTDRRW